MCFSCSTVTVAPIISHQCNNVVEMTRWYKRDGATRSTDTVTDHQPSMQQRSGNDTMVQTRQRHMKYRYRTSIIGATTWWQRRDDAAVTVLQEVQIPRTDHRCNNFVATTQWCNANALRGVQIPRTTHQASVQQRCGQDTIVLTRRRYTKYRYRTPIISHRCNNVVATTRWCKRD